MTLTPIELLDLDKMYVAINKNIVSVESSFLGH